MSQRSIAVVGAGAAGLVTAREAMDAGHDVTVFEQSDRVGGLWVYRESAESDPLGQHPAERLHGSLYASLRTNLPRDLMAFDGYTFDSAGGGRDDWPRYPGHAQVLEYVERFASDRGVLPRIRFGHCVAEVRPEGIGWRVDGEAFDAVAVCNGHFSEPLVPDLPGLADFQGFALHSHNYRRPEPFAGKRVVVLGSSVSGAELAREVGGVAEAVHFSGRAFRYQPVTADRTRRIKPCPSVERVLPSGVVLTDGEQVDGVDAILFCTGYHYRFPFLPPPLATVRNNTVTGLYRGCCPSTSPRWPWSACRSASCRSRSFSARHGGSRVCWRGDSHCRDAGNVDATMRGRSGACGGPVSPNATSTAWRIPSGTFSTGSPASAATHRCRSGSARSGSSTGPSCASIRGRITTCRSGGAVRLSCPVAGRRGNVRRRGRPCGVPSRIAL